MTGLETAAQPPICPPAPSVASAVDHRPAYDVDRVRADFPVLNQSINGNPLAYLDNAASSQMPRAVAEAVSRYFYADHSNIHRGVHTLSMRATDLYDEARKTVRRFINAADAREVIFVRGATEGINLVAQSFGALRVGPGHEILITAMEHHANIVPWQMLCREAGATLKVAPIADNGELDIEAFDALLSPRTRMVALCHASNALGTINPVRQLVDLAHAAGVPVLVDGAQATPHGLADVQALDCDFYVFSGHKTYGPTGIGALYGKMEHLLAMRPYQLGGDMIRSVTFERSTFARPPAKFEAGTPNIAGAVGLAAALEYLAGLGVEQVVNHEQALLSYATEQIREVPRLRVVGTAADKVGVLSFVFEDVHPHDVGTILDTEGVAIRTGHHCAQPLMKRLGVPATARASFACYNTRQEVDQLVQALWKVREVLTRCPI